MRDSLGGCLSPRESLPRRVVKTPWRVRYTPEKFIHISGDTALTKTYEGRGFSAGYMHAEDFLSAMRIRERPHF